MLKAMAREPAERYVLADAVAEDLGLFLEGRPLRWARQVGLVERAWRWSRRNPVVAGLLTAVVTVLILSAVGATHSNRRLSALLRQLEHAQGETRQQLRGSLLAQAQALRLSGQPGCRAKALGALAEAAHIRLGPDLRDEAIASLALVNLRPVREWDANSPAEMEIAVAFDAALERYTTVDANGTTVVRAVADDEVRAILPALRPRDSVTGMNSAPTVSIWRCSRAGSTPRRDQRIVVWDLARNTPALQLKAGRGIAFLPDGHSVATVLPEGKVGIFELPSGHEVRRVGRGFTARLCTGGLDPDGRRLVVLDPANDRAVLLMELTTGAILETIALPAVPVAEAVAWSGDGGSTRDRCR